MRKDELISVLDGLLKDVLRARFAGTERAKLARAHGYADGYMRALLDAELVDKATLLRAVSESRAEYLDAEDARRDTSSGVKTTTTENLGAQSAVA